MSLADKPDYYRTLLDCFLCIFDLEYSSLRRAMNISPGSLKSHDMLLTRSQNRCRSCF